MSAVSTLPAAQRRTSFLGSTIPPSEHIVSAISLRDEWVRHGLCTEPSDRPTTEAAVTELYRLVGAPEPEFVWVPSPSAAPHAAAELGLDPESWWPRAAHRLPPSGRIAALLSASRYRMDARIGPGHDPWRDQLRMAQIRIQSAEALARNGARIEVILDVAVRNSLRTTLFDGVATAVRTLVPHAARDALGIPWYGQQEAHRIGYYDAFRRAGIAAFRHDDLALLDVQSALAQSTGWWWALGQVCVMAERPTTLHTEPTPNSRHNEQRLHQSDGPALGFLDGTEVFVHHGTIVPEWVVLDPTAERIGNERNIEIRRCAIERLGWDAYLDQAQLTLVGEADDPGNPGSALQLYDSPSEWGRGSRVLLAVNGSVERDGQRRRYGLDVPYWIDNPVDAAGWTYGLSGAQYAQLVRRT
ncbi:DUF6745 domain-containing protein [Nocardia sp. KC 131]|uniref:DUF6745 domain-containing protein n=1 Tax=Nocardia arseniciresistens TaxID=3392119 RepID=UPI00398E83E4